LASSSSAAAALRTFFYPISFQKKNYKLPNGDGRNITIVNKKKETPNKYPRRAGMPNKKPL